MGMKVNLHTHTFRCNHASGVEREYIENSIKAGLHTIGFADHAPYYFPGEFYSGFRMRPELQEDYVKTLLALREEYKEQIVIKIGYETEYYPAFFAETVKMLTRYPVDYLILGQHFIDNEVTGKYSVVRTDDETYFKQYVDEVCEGIGTGLFTYVAHPDLVLFTGPDEIYREHYSRLINCAKKNDVPLEINFLGIRDRRQYPSEKFFALCGELGAEVCTGCDAHSADVAVDVASYKVALDMVNKFGLKLNENPRLHPVV